MVIGDSISQDGGASHSTLPAPVLQQSRLTNSGESCGTSRDSPSCPSGFTALDTFTGTLPDALSFREETNQ